MKISDAIITTDNSMLYYGSKKNYETQSWKEITEAIMVKDLEDPSDCVTLNSMFFLCKRKKKQFFIDPSFFKKFKSLD